MDLKETIAWFDSILAAAPQLQRGRDSHYTVGQVAAWATSAQSALESIYPPASAVRTRWTAALSKAAEEPVYFENTVVIDAAVGVFRSAVDLLRAGRLTSLLESVRAETVGDLLDQAEALNAKSYVVAATVIAGGALETHLHHLCTRHQIEWSGDGSINKYNDAIAQVRNGGQEIYSATDGKSVKFWGGRRNDAAHKPAEFDGTNVEVRTMIDGIRQFVSKTTL